MTPPVLTAAPARAHRRRIPPAPGVAHTAQAAEISRRLHDREPVTIEVDGHGRGWYVTGVGDGTYTVMRDGTTRTAKWVDVPLGQV